MIIVGGGASGLASAILLGRKGKRVTLLEKGSEVGKKIKVSGNGRCNIGNINISSNRYHSSNPQFLKDIAIAYSPKDIIKFFRSIGIEVVEESEGKLFPMGFSARSVVDLLVAEAHRVKVDIVTDCEVEDISYKNGYFFVKSPKGIFKDRRVLISAGSPAAPQLGGDSKLLTIAKNLGHNIIPTSPALTAIETNEKWCKRVAGLKMKAKATLFVNQEEKISKEGDILFTNYGISGLAILDISIFTTLALQEWAYCELKIDLLPKYSKSQLINFLINRIDKERNLPISLWLAGILPQKIIPIILNLSKISAKIESNLTRKDIGKLVYTIKNISLSVKKLRDYKYAEVSIGGVDTLDINPSTLESKILKDLYFSGEILDITGDRGGFNFHWAWSSAMRVASKF